MQLLVTGGAGFIGSNFIHSWLSNYPEDNIINLDKLTYAGHPESLKDIESDTRYQFVKGDICDDNVVNETMRGVDLVVNFAAESHVDRSVDDPNAFVKTNVLGTLVLLRAALKEGVKRFHHVSTDEVFGALELDSSEKFSETTLYNPRSPYAASKAASDLLVRSYFHTHQLPFTITNCGNNYGPYQDVEKFIPRFITNALADQPLPLYGDGKSIREWVHVRDHCRAIEAVIKKGRVGETYLVGGEEKSNLEVAQLILKTLKKPEDLISFVSDRPGHDRRYAVNDHKLRSELGWKPEQKFEQGLEKTIVWYQENKWWWQAGKESTEDFYSQLDYGK